MSVPTAEEILSKYYGPFVDAESAMIEFAKLHCEAQAQAISEQRLQDFNGNQVSIKKESILDLYPLSNIK